MIVNKVPQRHQEAFTDRIQLPRRNVHWDDVLHERSNNDKPQRGDAVSRMTSIFAISLCRVHPFCLNKIVLYRNAVGFDLLDARMLREVFAFDLPSDQLVFVWSPLTLQILPEFSPRDTFFPPGAC